MAVEAEKMEMEIADQRARMSTNEMDRGPRLI